MCAIAIRRETTLISRWWTWVVALAAISSGSVATAAVTLLDFEDMPAPQLITTQYGARGVLFPVAYLEKDSNAHSGTQVLRSNTFAAEFPFDPLIIQRKRLRLFFDYEYRFEAYVPKHKRIFGYFVCPVLIGDRIIAALDLKTDRSRQQLLVQRWKWIGRGASRAHQQQVETALHKFEQFQLCRS